MEIRNAQKEDWIALQGGKPLVTRNKIDGMILITHDYPKGEGMQIRRHNPIDPNDTVRFGINGDVVEFTSALVKAVEGDPCERQSRKVGGDGYPRIR